MSKLAGRSLLFAALAVPIAMLAGPLTASAESEPVTMSRGGDGCCDEDVDIHVEDVNANHHINGIYMGNTDANIHVHDHWWFDSFAASELVDSEQAAGQSESDSSWTDDVMGDVAGIG